MKFNEFEALDAKLRQKGTSINETVKNITGEYLFEKDPIAGVAPSTDPSTDPPQTKSNPEKEVSSKKLNTKGSGFSLSPDFHIAKRKLINNAKKYIKTGQSNIIDKLLPKILKGVGHTANSAVALQKNGKTPKEIVKALKETSAKARSYQQKQMKIIDTAIENLGKNYQSRINTIVEKNVEGENDKIKIANYWILLQSQVQQKLYSNITKKQNEFIKETVKNNPELEKVIKLLSGAKDHELALNKIQNKVSENKKKYEDSLKQGDEEKKSEDGKPEEGKPEEGKTKEGKPEEGNTEEKSAKSYLEDIANETDEQSLTTLYNDLVKAKHIGDKNKKILLKKLKEKGIPKESE